jgi:CHAT domain-containing protein
MYRLKLLILKSTPRIQVVAAKWQQLVLYMASLLLLNMATGIGQEIHSNKLRFKKEAHGYKADADLIIAKADHLRAAKVFSKAKKEYERALRLYRKAHDIKGEAAALGGIGSVFSSKGQKNDSIIFLYQAAVLHNEAKDPEAAGDVLHGLLLDLKPRNRSGAILFGKLAINLYEQNRFDLHKTDVEASRRFLKLKEPIYREVVDLLIREGRLPEAERVLSFLKYKDDNFLFITRGDDEVASPMFPSSIPLDHQEAKAEKQLRSIAENLISIGRKQVLSPPNTSRQKSTRNSSIKRELEVALAALQFQEILLRLEYFYALKIQAGSGNDHIAKLQMALKELGAGTVGIYSLVSNNRLILIYVTSNSSVVRSTYIDGPDFNRKVMAFWQALSDPRVDPLPLAQELYRTIIGPIEKDIKDSGASTLMWSLDGSLRWLPFTALHDGQMYLVERYNNTVFAGDLTSESIRQVPSADPKVLGLGTSKAHSNYVALPSVADELHGIIRDVNADEGGVFPGKMLLDEAFTLESMMDSLRKRYSIAHIASHFRYSGNRDTDGFLLGNGNILTVAQINSFENLFEGVDLLTLSACNTGIGENGEIFATSLLKLGAKSVLVSKWAIDDRSTGILMQTFYRLWRSGQGLSKIEALRQAQLVLLKGKHKTATPTLQKRGIIEDIALADGTKIRPYKPDPKAPYAHPYYWAPFVLIGNWR